MTWRALRTLWTGCAVCTVCTIVTRGPLWPLRAVQRIERVGNCTNRLARGHRCIVGITLGAHRNFKKKFLADENRAKIQNGAKYSSQNTQILLFYGWPNDISLAELIIKGESKVIASRGRVITIEECPLIGEIRADGSHLSKCGKRSKHEQQQSSNDSKGMPNLHKISYAEAYYLFSCRGGIY